MPNQKDAHVVDFNRVLVWLNAIVAVTTIVAFLQVGGNHYIDGDSILLATLLALQTHLALWVERRRRDPFVILLIFILVGYYSLRILTLLRFPSATILERFPYSQADTNFALLFIVAANLFLYAGLFVTKAPPNLSVSLGSWRARAPTRTLLLVVAAITFVYATGAIWGENVPRVLLFLSTIFGQGFILLMALTYFVVFRKTLSWRLTAAFVVLLVGEMVLHTVAGSRSAIVAVIQNALVVFLAFAGSIQVSRRVVWLGSALAPVFLALLVASFTISTYVRALGGGEQFSIGSAIALSKTAGGRLTEEFAIQSWLPLIFSRAGFFDYSAEVIAHSEQYERVINLPAYVRSVSDNVLTPGYDLFDQAKISNSLKFVYADLGRPSKIASGFDYQSDQLGIYGELYVLFGYASLPLFFFGAALAKRAYASFKDSDPYMLTIKRVLTLSMFSVVINSFGLDWALLNFVPNVASIYIYRYFFATGRGRATGMAAPANATPTLAST